MSSDDRAHVLRDILDDEWERTDKLWDVELLEK